MRNNAAIEIGGVQIDVDSVIVLPVVNHPFVAMTTVHPVIEFTSADIWNVPIRRTAETHVKVEFAPENRWEFPSDRFIEYEPSDEVWARPIRFGKEVEYTPTLEMSGVLDHVSGDTIRVIGRTISDTRGSLDG